jgi:hypothetical protein
MVVATDIPADFNPLNHHTLVPSKPNLVRKHALYCLSWELKEYLPDEHKHIMHNVADMKNARLPFVISLERQFMAVEPRLRSTRWQHVQATKYLLPGTGRRQELFLYVRNSTLDYSETSSTGPASPPPQAQTVRTSLYMMLLCSWRLHHCNRNFTTEHHLPTRYYRVCLHSYFPFT